MRNLILAVIMMLMTTAFGNNLDTILLITDAQAHPTSYWTCDDMFEDADWAVCVDGHFDFHKFMWAVETSSWTHVINHWQVVNGDTYITELRHFDGSLLSVITETSGLTYWVYHEPN